MSLKFPPDMFQDIYKYTVLNNNLCLMFFHKIVQLSG